VYWARVLVKRGPETEEERRQLLKRALSALPKRKHVDTIAEFATLEMREGLVDLGRALFDDILASYPRRLDLWDRLLDQELRLGDAARLRGLFDRVTSLPHLTLKQGKHLFKRYLKYESEQTQPDSQRLDYVKARAEDFVRAMD